ncbi:hypothetical protein QM588_00415 [Rhodococcus sp. IEGM 1354]|uniref:hypothetical protein n=1 Tax=Rhodococcus sp. IEGM 1354 TaxID=3047088 RepID=UPI0024B72F72|nr:hypothetical protein [Rhodococcus sp. IEGM 1354]MDI9928851.1 hypothetical protein [Rhodococcus sp. IEGM 1354]
MSESPPDLITHWQGLNALAEAGTLTIPADVAAKCDAACDVYLAHLEKMQADARKLSETKSWGDMKSAQDLQRRFARLATGKDTSLDVILQQHIDVIDSMRTLFRRYFEDTAEVDSRTAATIAAPTPEN